MDRSDTYRDRDMHLDLVPGPCRSGPATRHSFSLHMPRTSPNPAFPVYGIAAPKCSSQQDQEGRNQKVRPDRARTVPEWWGDLSLVSAISVSAI
jgi:hypothetical protein